MTSWLERLVDIRQYEELSTALRKLVMAIEAALILSGLALLVALVGLVR